MTERLARPLGSMTPLGRGRYRDVAEIGPIRGLAYPCTDGLRDLIDAHVTPQGAPRFVVDLMTGQTWAERDTLSQGIDWTPVEPVLGPVHGLGVLLPHETYAVHLWDRSGEAGDLLASIGRPEEAPHDRSGRLVLTLTSLKIHRLALHALIRESADPAGASLPNAAARLGHLSRV